MPARRLLPSLLALLALSPLAHGADTKTTPPADLADEAWQQASLYLFKESYQTFGDIDTREGRLGRASLLLLQQPKTDANIARATAELEALASQSPSDETAITARYLLGRIAHAHRTPTDPAAAAVHYRQLIAEHPEHFLADQARIKLALIEIYEAGLSREELLSRIDRIGRDADALSRPGSRRDLHLLLATACSNLRLDDRRCLRHYLAADQAGVTRPILRANVTVAIGELASRAGQADLARRYFERYLAEFQRDYRRTFVKDKLAALPAATPAQEANR